MEEDLGQVGPRLRFNGRVLALVILDLALITGWSLLAYAFERYVSPFFRRSGFEGTVVLYVARALTVGTAALPLQAVVADVLSAARAVRDLWNEDKG